MVSALLLSERSDSSHERMSRANGPEWSAMPPRTYLPHKRCAMVLRKSVGVKQQVTATIGDTTCGPSAASSTLRAMCSRPFDLLTSERVYGSYLPHLPGWSVQVRGVAVGATR